MRMVVTKLSFEPQIRRPDALAYVVELEKSWEQISGDGRHRHAYLRLEYLDRDALPDWKLDDEVNV